MNKSEEARLAAAQQAAALAQVQWAEMSSRTAKAEALAGREKRRAADTRILNARLQAELAEAKAALAAIPEPISDVKDSAGIDDGA